MSTIVTDTEIKSLLGISGTSQDAVIAFLNEAYTDLLFELMGVQDLLEHDVVDERVQIFNCEYFYTSDFPVDVESIVMKTISGDVITGYSFRQGDLGSGRKIYLIDALGNPKYMYHEQIRIDYSAGYSEVEGEEEEPATNNVPKAFKMAIALMVGGGLAEKSKKGGVSEYRIGSKMVKFRDEDESMIFQKILRKYLANHIKPVIAS